MLGIPDRTYSVYTMERQYSAHILQNACHIRCLSVVLRIIILSRAVQLIACDSHAHLISKAGSVIGGTFPSPVFSWSSS